MLTRVKQKLTDKHGETLVESLFSIVIISLSVVVFTVAAVTVTKVGSIAKNKTGTLDENYTAAVLRTEPCDTAQITVEYAGGNGVYTVDVFGGGSMYSYSPKE